MDEDTPRTEPAAATSPGGRGKGMMWALLAVVIAFFAGFLWQFYEATTVRDQLTAVEQELEVERLRIRLGQAAMAAQAGDYESARRQMSDFFSELQEQGNSLPGPVRTVGADFLAMRDDVITGLSRSNPEYAGVLYGMLEELSDAVERATRGAAGADAPGEPAESVEEPSSDPTGGQIEPEP